MRRLKQVLYYGRLHAKQIAKEHNENQLRIFIDILRCFSKYKMWSNQYLKEQFWQLDSEKRKEVGGQYLIKGEERDAWSKTFVDTRKFLNKWTSRKWETTLKRRDKRNEAYRKFYNMGTGCVVEYNVELSRQHYLPGSIEIGNNVLLAKHCFIDYSGHVIIKDGVKLANDVIIESHHRDIDAYNDGKDINIPTELIIEENAYIGSRAIILDSCNYIGKHARIGAGAVVTKDVPDYAVVGGVPAKVIRML